MQPHIIRQQVATKINVLYSNRYTIQLTYTKNQITKTPHALYKHYVDNI